MTITASAGSWSSSASVLFRIETKFMRYAYRPPTLVQGIKSGLLVIILYVPATGAFKLPHYCLHCYCLPCTNYMHTVPFSWTSSSDCMQRCQIILRSNAYILSFSIYEQLNFISPGCSLHDSYILWTIYIGNVTWIEFLFQYCLWNMHACLYMYMYSG